MTSTWQRNWRANKEYPPLDRDIDTEVVIIGGGITGITLAYLLAKAGKKVVVLEKGTLGLSSYTALSTAMVMSQVDTNFRELEKMFGHKTAEAVVRAGEESIEQISKIISTENIFCEFARVPAYIYGNDDKEWADLKVIAETMQKAGFPIDIHEDGGLPGSFFQSKPYYVFRDQAKFDPLLYAGGLRAKAEEYGALFFENTEALDIMDGKDANISVVKTSKASIKAVWVAVATYDPFNHSHELFARKGLYTSYMYELSIPKGLLPTGLYIDGHSPYHYFRVDEKERRDRLIIGGADHRHEIKMDPEKNYKEVLDYAEMILGGKEYEIITRWDGGILETIDGLPFIGSYSKKYPNRLVATGYSGNGLTYATIAARMLSGHILGKTNPYASIFDPKRKASFAALFIKGRDYIGEFLGGALKNMFRS